MVDKIIFEWWRLIRDDNECYKRKQIIADDYHPEESVTVDFKVGKRVISLIPKNLYFKI